MDITSSAVHIPEIWGELIRARNEEYFMADRVWRWDEDAAGYGDRINAPRISNLNVVSVPADGSVTFESPTETEVTITLDKRYGVHFRITDDLMQKSKYPLKNEYGKKAGEALAKQIETDLLGLYSGLSQDAATASGGPGAAPANMDESYFTFAIQLLDDGLAPADNRYFIGSPKVKRDLRLLNRLTSEEHRSGAGKQLTSGRMTMDWHGVEILSSPLVISASSERKNIMWYKEAFALAIQKKVAMTEFARDGWRRNFGALEIYGFGETRDLEAVTVSTVA